MLRSARPIDISNLVKFLPDNVTPSHLDAHIAFDWMQSGLASTDSGSSSVCLVKRNLKQKFLSHPHGEIFYEQQR